MPSLVIKNLPKPIHDRLKAAAKANRRSITQQAIFELEGRIPSLADVKFPEPIKPLRPIKSGEIERIIRRARDRQ